MRDPFGVRSLYYVEHDGVFYFASELKQLLAVPGLPVELNPAALHKYLTFSFVPGEDVPIRGIRRLLPGQLGVYRERPVRDPRPISRCARRSTRSWQTSDGRPAHPPAAERPSTRRLNGEREVGLFLSGGIDSSGVAVWLKEAGVQVRAFSLDFGAASVEQRPGRAVAEHLDIPLEMVPSSGEDIGAVLRTWSGSSTCRSATR